MAKGRKDGRQSKGRQKLRMCKKCSGRGFKEVGGMFMKKTNWPCGTCHGRGRI